MEALICYYCNKEVKELIGYGDYCKECYDLSIDEYRKEKFNAKVNALITSTHLFDSFHSLLLNNNTDKCCELCEAYSSQLEFDGEIKTIYRTYDTPWSFKEIKCVPIATHSFVFWDEKSSSLRHL